MNYEQRMVTEVVAELRDVEQFKAEIEVLKRLGLNIDLGGDFAREGELFVEIHHDEAAPSWAAWFGGYDIGTEMFWSELPDLLARFERALPAEGVPPEIKQTHDEMWEVPPTWVKDVIQGDDNFDVSLFIQRHIQPGTHAVLFGEGHEGLRSLSVWCCYITSEYITYANDDDLITVAKIRHDKELKERSEANGTPHQE